MQRRWLPAEDDILRQDYRRTRTALLAQRLGRSVESLKKRAGRLKIQNRGPLLVVAWTPERIALLQAEYGVTPNERLAERLGCTIAAMQRAARKFRAARVYPNKRLDPERRQIGLRLIGTAPQEEIASALGCSTDAIHHLIRSTSGDHYTAVRQREMGHERDKQRLRILLAHARGMLTIIEAARLLNMSYAEVSKALVTEAVRGAGLAKRQEANHG